MTKLQHVLLAISVAVGWPLAQAALTLTPNDLHHPSTWLTSAAIGCIAGLAVLFITWANSSGLKVQSPVVKAPPTNALVPASEYTTYPPVIASQTSPQSAVYPPIVYPASIAPPSTTVAASTALPEGWTPAPPGA